MGLLHQCYLPKVKTHKVGNGKHVIFNTKVQENTQETYIFHPHCPSSTAGEFASLAKEEIPQFSFKTKTEHKYT